MKINVLSFLEWLLNINLSSKKIDKKDEMTRFDKFMERLCNSAGIDTKSTFPELHRKIQIKNQRMTDKLNAELARSHEASVKAALAYIKREKRKRDFFDSLKNTADQIEQLHSSVKKIKIKQRVESANQLCKKNKDLFWIKDEKEFMYEFNKSNSRTISAMIRADKQEAEKEYNIENNLPINFKPSKMRRRTKEEQQIAKERQRKMDNGLIPQRPALRRNINN